MQLRGMTWDHPRGYKALEAAAARLDGGHHRGGPAMALHRIPLNQRWRVAPLGLLGV